MASSFNIDKLRGYKEKVAGKPTIARCHEILIGTNHVWGRNKWHNPICHRLSGRDRGTQSGSIEASTPSLRIR